MGLEGVIARGSVRRSHDNGTTSTLAGGTYNAFSGNIQFYQSNV